MVDSSIIRSIVNNRTSLSFILPGLILIGTLLAVLVIDLLVPYLYKRYGLRIVPIAGICLALYATIQLGSQPSVQAGLSLSNHLLKLDPWAIFWHGLLLGMTLGVLLTTSPKPSLADTAVYLVMLLGTLLGAYWLVMAQHWLIIYLSLTLMTLASAVLIGTSWQALGTVASLQYLLYSAVGAAMMLWGMSYLYGSTGTLSLAASSFVHDGQLLPKVVLLAGFLLALSGILITLGALPFHYWLADVYQGAPMTVVAYLATVPKLAAVASMVRLYKQLIQQGGMGSQLQGCIALIAILTIAIGHIAALMQTQPRRVLAYGSIAQGGLLLAGIGACTSHYAIIAYYGTVYGIMSLASWIGLKVFRRLASSEHLHDYAGLGRQFPVLGLCVVIALLSLVGLPPTAGFTSKLFIFGALWEAAQMNESPLLATLFILGLLGSIVSLYYYLQLPYMLFCKPMQRSALPMPVPWTEQFTLLVLTAMLLGLFFSAGPSMAVLQSWSLLP